MQDTSLRLLMVEDSKDDEFLIIRGLKKGGYNPVYERIETASAMKKALKEKSWDVILCDYKLPKFNDASAIALLKEVKIDIPIIIVSGTIGENEAIDCMRLGAQDLYHEGKLITSLSGHNPRNTRCKKQRRTKIYRRKITLRGTIVQDIYRTRS